jgi:uncharacterized lipoprotein YmbA
MKTIGVNKRKRVLAVAPALALALAGCATSPTPVYYTLAPPAVEVAGSRSDIAAEIGPFELPEYLDRPQIVTAGPGATVNLDEFHRWVEPLEQMFGRTLAASVGRQLGSDEIVETAMHRGLAAPYRVLGSLQRFENNNEGRAILEVQWAIVDRDGNIAKPGTRGRYAAGTGDSATIDARIQALGETIELFAADVAAALQARPRP